MAIDNRQHISNLIDTQNIPGDIGLLEDITQAAVKLLPIEYYDEKYGDDPNEDGTKKYVRTESDKGAKVEYKLVLLTEQKSYPIFGSELRLVLCKGAGNRSEFETIVNWHWPLKPHLDKFNLQGFAYTPEAFLEVFLLLADIKSMEDFYVQIAEAFFGTTDDGYEDFFAAIETTVNGYNDNSTAVDNEVKSIIAQIKIILGKVKGLLGQNWTIKKIVNEIKNISPSTDAAIKDIEAAAKSIETSATNLQSLLKLNNKTIDIYKDTVLALFKNIKDDKVKFDRLRALFKKWLGNIEENEIHDFLMPQFDVTVKNMKATLEFPRKWLVPMKEDPVGSGNYIENTDINSRSEIICPVGALKYSTKTGFKFEHDSGVITLTRSIIGKTGIIIAVSEVKPDFSHKANITEATAEGRPKTFTGAFIEKATIILPDKWFGVDPADTMKIIGEKMLIGEGGFSGKVKLEAGKTLKLVLGKKTTGTRKGFGLELDSFGLTFKQNQIIESSISGTLTIPKWDDAEIKIEMSFKKDGDFSITTKISGGKKIKLKNLLTVTIHDLKVGREDGQLFLDVNGDIDFSNNQFFSKLSIFDEKNPFKVKNFRIYSDGSFELQGGTIPLPESVRLNVKPVEVYITAIHIGAHKQMYKEVERSYKYIGMDAGISVNPGGVKAEGDGMKYYFTVDDDAGKPHHSFFRIEGLSIDLTIPGTASPDQAVLLLKGYLNMKEDEYIGGIKFSLPKARIAGGAEMRYKPSVPAFLIDVNLELPTALPLGNTGMGIFGFRGLFGLRYVASKDAVSPPATNWFEYYKAPPAKGIRVQKFSDLSRKPGGSGGTPFSIGAGISLATMSDDGKAFSSQLFLLISIPNLIMFEGRANILGERLGIEDTGEPPFYAMIAYSPGDSIITGMGVNYNIPRDGDKPGQILKLNAEIEAAYFFRDSKAWYVHVGTKNKPISAEILSILKGYSYLMLSAYGIEAGAGVHFTIEKNYCGGVVRANGKAYFDVWGKVTFPRSKPDGSGKEPTQFGGGIAVGGSLDVSAFGIGFYLGLSAILTGEAPQPMRVAGSAEMYIAIKLVVKTIEKRFTVEFIWEKEPKQIKSAIFALPASVGGIGERGTAPVGAVSLKSGNSYGIRYFGATEPKYTDNFPKIPINAAVDLQFDKPVLPDSTVSDIIGGFINAAEGYEDLVPPAKGNRQVLHRYLIKEFVLEIYENGVWKKYNPYKAMFPNAPNTCKVGYWQKTGGEYNKIRLLAQTPFAYMQQGEPEWTTPEQFGLSPATLLCKGKERTRKCISWEQEGTAWKPGLLHPYQELSFLVTENDSMVAPVLSLAAPVKITQALALRVQAPGSLELYLPEAAAEAEIQIWAVSPQFLTITWYMELRDTNGNLTGYQAVKTETKARSKEPTRHTYIDDKQPVSKIVLTPSAPDKANMQRIELAILEQTDKVFLEPNGNWGLVLSQLRGERLTERGKSCYFTLSGQDKEDIMAYIRKIELDWKTCLEKQKQLDLEVVLKCPKGQPPSSACDLAKNAAAANKAQGEQLKQNLELAKEIATWPPHPLQGPNNIPTPSISCFYWVKGLCWLTERDYFYNKSLPSQAKIDAEYGAMKDAVSLALQPVWRPGHKYRAMVTVHDTVDPTKSQDVWFGFETEKPFNGVLEKTKEQKNQELADNKDFTQVQYKEAKLERDDDGPELSLKYYIDFERSYPDAGGRLVYAKPMYYQLDPNGESPIVISFKDAHARHFFRQWYDTKGQPAENYEMEVLIKDPTEDAPPTTDTKPHEQPVLEVMPSATRNWESKNVPASLPADLQMMHDMLQNGKGCVFVLENGAKVPPKLVPPKPKHIAVNVQNLKPEKLYAVVVNVHQKGVWKREIHRYNFRSSRYPNFETHIKSYQQTSEEGQSKDMVFAIKTNIDALEKTQILKVVAGVATGNANLEAAYQDPIDRIVFGILKQTALPAPVCTEFNFIFDKYNNVFGLLVRSPEAFNDPKLPGTELARTIRVFAGSSEVTVEKAFSKDGASVLLMPKVATWAFPTQQLSVRFAHWMWNAKDEQYREIAVQSTGVLAVPTV
jgi:hypothetical protein